MVRSLLDFMAAIIGDLRQKSKWLRPHGCCMVALLPVRGSC
jgi:hypothetical protein